MVKKLDRIVSWFQTAVTVALGIISVQVVEFLKDFVTISEIELVLAYIVVAILVVKGLETFIKWAISNSVWLRRIIMGKQFIEGYWIDKLVDVENEEIISIGILKITYQDGMLHSSGSGYSPNYDNFGSFKTYISKYDDFKLNYGYVSLMPFTPNIEVYGHGQYLFDQGNKYPVRFNGFMQDSHFRNKILLNGRKILDESILVNLDDDEVRANLVKEYSVKLNVNSGITSVSSGLENDSEL